MIKLTFSIQTSPGNYKTVCKVFKNKKEYNDFVSIYDNHINGKIISEIQTQ